MTVRARIAITSCYTMTLHFIRIVSYFCSRISRPYNPIVLYIHVALKCRVKKNSELDDTHAYDLEFFSYDNKLGDI